MKTATTAKQRLEEFDKRLREVTKEDPLIRPFLCYGSPLECPIFLVGINPSRSAPFWPRWDARTGCDKQGWIADYLKKNGRLSPTRQRIERLVDVISPTRCLETNVFTKITPKASELSAADRDTTIFEFLLKSIRPRVVFLHGKHTVEALSKLTKAAIPFHKLNRPDCPLNRYTTITFEGFTFDVIAGPQLAWGWSYDRVAVLGKSLADKSKMTETSAQQKLLLTTTGADNHRENHNRSSVGK